MLASDVVTQKKEFDKLSIDITRSLSKEEKKNDGIYFTPPGTIYKHLEYLKPYFSSIKTVLEPSCGSCEFIKAIRALYPEGVSITGIEKNKNVFDAIRHITDVDLRNEDFLSFSEESKYDLIIGNPPYFVMKKKDVDKKYYPYFEGRPNIFILFIIKSLSLLNQNGILSFVLPKNFLNCLYYSKTRKYIYEEFTILDIMECSDKYIDTQQETIVVIIQKGVNGGKCNDAYTLNGGDGGDGVNYGDDYYIFGMKDDIVELRKLYMGSTTLNKLDYSVSVGSVVWNQHKSILTDDTSKTRLIYSSDIGDGVLNLKTYKNDEKKNFIAMDGVTDPMLVINRGYGMGSYKFDHCLIEGGFEYLIENHLICIKYNKGGNREEIVEAFRSIIESLNDERTKQFIKLYFGNNAINTTEMNNVLPIYLL